MAAAESSPAAAVSPADVDGLIELGAVRGAYGVKGWLKIAPHDADASVLRALKRWWIRKGGAPWQAVDVQTVRRHSGTLLVRWKGWDSPEAAEALRGAVVAAPRSMFPPLPDGEVYWVDLIGCLVTNREGRCLGRVAAVRDNGAHELLEVQGEDGTALVPLVPAYVDVVDAAAKSIRVDWQVEWSR
jgi:16S rRNA processing protein RimM